MASKKSSLKVNVTNQALQVLEDRLVFTSTSTSTPQQSQIELPAQTIEGAIIKNEQQFQVALQQLFASIKLKSKNIVLSIPEHQTFVRTSEVADLESDVNEAIIWKIQQFLPQSAEQMNLDWAVLPTESTPPFPVQIAAIPHIVINAYLQALSPYVRVAAIETPSLTLSRLAQSQPHPCLLIDAEPTSVLAISNTPGSIELTSVSTQESLPSVINEMLSYYQSKFELQLEAIYLTGSLAGSLQPQISNSQIIDEPTKNPQLAMAYALAKKPVAPAQDPNTLNLAPSEIQLEFETAVTNDVYRRIALISILFVGILNVIVAGFTFITWNQQRQLQQTVGTSGPSIASISQDSNSQTTRDQLNTILTIAPNREEVKNLLEEITSYVKTVEVTNIVIDSENEQITISGISPTQEALLELKSLLETSETFSEVRLPLSIFEKRTDIPFTLTISWNQPQLYGG